MALKISEPFQHKGEVRPHDDIEIRLFLPEIMYYTSSVGSINSNG